MAWLSRFSGPPTGQKVVSMVGAELSIEQAGIPEQIPVEACYLGWQQSLEQLAKLVEPEIPDGGP